MKQKRIARVIPAKNQNVWDLAYKLAALVSKMENLPTAREALGKKSKCVPPGNLPMLF